MTRPKEDKATKIVKRRYDRIAPIYDWVVQTAERGQSKSWRSLLWNKVEGKEILEVGAGTGLNLLFADTANHNLTAIDLVKARVSSGDIEARQAEVLVYYDDCKVREIRLYFDRLELGQAFSANLFDRILISKINTASLKGLK